MNSSQNSKELKGGCAVERDVKGALDGELLPVESVIHKEAREALEAAKKLLDELP